MGALGPQIVEVRATDATGGRLVHGTFTATAVPPVLPEIAFASDRGGNQDIYVMGADGSYPVNVTHAL